MVNSGFHIDRTISIGNILTLIVVAFTAFIWLTDIDKRVVLNTQSIDHHNDRLDRSERRNETQFKQILEKLDAIEERLAGPRQPLR